jgi:hypothetical protein
MNTLYTLEEVLANRVWERRAYPFPHIVAQTVFTQSYYRKVSDAFNVLLRMGLEEQRCGGRLSRGMLGYDAYGLTFGPEYQGPFSLFMSRPWHDMTAGLFGVACTGHINCGIHHHAVKSADGWVHNDLNPAYFVDYPSDDGINVVRHTVCSYAYGRVFLSGVKPRQVVRSVALLFYLSNPPWSPGDGGETGLYECKDNPVDRPASVIPPINNSILIFQCTPYSFHSFISNRTNPRNCVIMWLHSKKADVEARWGEGKVVEWPTVVTI